MLCFIACFLQPYKHEGTFCLYVANTVFDALQHGAGGRATEALDHFIAFAFWTFQKIPHTRGALLKGPQVVCKDNFSCSTRWPSFQASITSS